MSFILLSQALASGQAINVSMNKAGFVSFVNGNKKAIGTSNLNGCTAVLLASKRGAILAHISPLPHPTTDPQAAKDHTRKQMTDFLQIYTKEEDFRMAEDVKKSGIVCGVFGGSIALDDQMKLIESILLENLEDNPRPAVIKYNIDIPTQRPPAAGEVLIDGRGPEVRVIVEDKDLGWKI